MSVAGSLWTESGSAHLLDLGSAQVTRLRAAEEPVPNVAVTALRRDGEPVPLLASGPVVVGLPLAMALQVRSDAVQTTRPTTPVVSIRRLPLGNTASTETGRHGPTSCARPTDGASGPNSEGE
jgi:hypothetical protein